MYVAHVHLHVVIPKSVLVNIQRGKEKKSKQKNMYRSSVELEMYEFRSGILGKQFWKID